MTTLPAKYCPIQDCSNRTDGGPCPEHAVAREHRRANFAFRRLYRQKRWRVIRLRVLFEEPLCGDCVAVGRTTASSDVHHKIRPRNEPQFFDRDNLAGLCGPCHAARTGRGE